MREKIGAWADGTNSYEGKWRASTGAIRIACSVTVNGGAVTIDFGGTGAGVQRGINVPFCYTRAMANYAIKCPTVPRLPNNEGALKPITVTAPEGCILNALPPSPTGGRHLVGHFVTPAVFRALVSLPCSAPIPREPWWLGTGDRPAQRYRPPDDRQQPWRYQTRFPARGLLDGQQGLLRKNMINGEAVHRKGQFTGSVRQTTPYRA